MGVKKIRNETFKEKNQEGKDRLKPSLASSVTRLRMLPLKTSEGRGECGGYGFPGVGMFPPVVVAVAQAWTTVPDFSSPAPMAWPA